MVKVEQGQDWRGALVQPASGRVEFIALSVPGIANLVELN